MKTKILSLIALTASICSLTAAEHRADYNVIPIPKEVTVDDAHVFTLEPGMCIAYDANHEVLCGGNPETLEFLKTVLGEICEVFPSKYIHIGGDECPKNCWHECPECQAKIKELGLVDKDGKKIYSFEPLIPEELTPEQQRLILPASSSSWCIQRGTVEPA